MNIGVFDSGLGGLTIFKALLKGLPNYNYVYLGDNARVPYGNRSPEIIYQFTKEAIDFLVKKNCLIIVIACNTSTTTSLKRIQKEYLPKYYPNVKVLGVVKPAVEEIIEGKHERVGVIGTKATVNSGAYIREIKKIKPQVEVTQQACPLLVPFIEDLNKNKRILHLILKEYLEPLKKKNIDTLLLGCTHYEIIEKEIKKVIGSKVKIISESSIVLKKFKVYLKNHSEIENKLTSEKKVEYYFTDKNSDFNKLKSLFY